MSALEASITLDDVFVVVGAKRVPLAPELAGYLTLEIAEGAGATVGDVDPKSVFIGEEGSVALVVRPRRDQATGDTEASTRAILARLLDASGSQTAALAAVARRRQGGGLAALVEELEAALIPVNRAAGRRALARLAREVKRVTLGVGRNAALAPSEPPRESQRRGSSPSYSAVRDPAPAPPPSRPAVHEEPPVAAKAERISEVPDSSNLPTREVRKGDVAASLAAYHAGQARALTPTPPPGRDAAGSDVDSLLASFGVSGGEKTAARELKALVGIEPTPPPPTQHESRPPRSTNDADVEALLAMSEPGPPVEKKPEYVAPPRTAIDSPPTAISPALAREPIAEAGPVSAPTMANAGTPLPSVIARDAIPDKPEPRNAPTGPSMRRVLEQSPVDRGFREPRAPRTDRALTITLLILLGAGAVAIYLLKPSFLTGHPPVRPAPAPVASSTAPPPARCKESLVVTDAPNNAEILLRVGQAPVDVERMPVGARLEFVATAEGFAPKRAVVPAGATWDPGPDGKPRYEVAVQLDKSRARAGGVDNWPAGEPGSEVGGKGAPGTVHLVSTPRGAEVWLLAGLGPEARIDDLACAGDVDVLVAGPTTLRKRLHVAKSDFAAVDGGTDKQASVSAK